ncbi:MAG: ABC transporter permease, partial [Planctomycetota bacterium]
MRAAYAVLYDSFHAALASRILWVAFIGIWCLLALLTPFGYRETVTTSFLDDDIAAGTRLKGLLAQGYRDEKSGERNAVASMVSALDESLRDDLASIVDGKEQPIRYDDLTSGINGLLETDNWYEKELWQGFEVSGELSKLEFIKSDELSDLDLKRRRRLRVEAALPGVFRPRSPRSIALVYAGLDFPSFLKVSVDKSQFKKLVNQFALPLIIRWMLGFVFVLMGVLVTASVIPEMLQPGSLHLLLSKPISRTTLLLTKFLGGCSFVVLCVSQLILGLFLIAGLRLDIWNVRLLWCLPAAVFLFSVFYSVSVLAGLIWRSPILAIGVTVLFGGLCLIVGFVGGLMDGIVDRQAELTGVARFGEDWIASTRGGDLLRIDQEGAVEKIIDSETFDGDRVLPP